MSTVAWTCPAEAYVLKRVPSGEIVHWETAPVPFRVREGGSCGPPRAVLRDATVIAMESWRGISAAPDLVLEAGRPPTAWGVDGENGVYVLCDWPFDQVLAVTVAASDESGRMIEADVLLNGEMPLAVLHEGGEESTRYDVASVLTHEMGHVLGLDESNVLAATMWPTTRRGETSQRTLASDDEQGVLRIYGESTPTRSHGEHAVYGCSASAMGKRREHVLPLSLALSVVIGMTRVRRAARWRQRQRVRV